MFGHRFFALASLSVLMASIACTAVGCAADDDALDDSADPGDGQTDDNEIVAERQLNGSDLPQKTIALTFDDGPGRRTAELAEYLEAEGIPAAFFINGKNAPGHQVALDAIVNRGHLLANHTQNHLQLTRQSAAKIVSEVEQTDDVIREYQPNGPWVLRAPFGAWNGATARALNGSAMKKYVGSVFWDQGGQLTGSAAADWACWGQGVGVQRCGDLYMNEIRSKGRGIVLMHDIHDKTVDMVKRMVPALKAEGYKFVRVDQSPAVARAIGSNSGGVVESPDQCQSATLGRPVNENACVQQRSTQQWFRCVDGDWLASSPSDPACTEKHPL